MKNKFRVFINNHSIFLTEEQRYDLFACIPVHTVGALVFAEIQNDMQAKSIKEVFVNYIIDCEPNVEPIEVVNQEIKLHLPIDMENFLTIQDDAFENFPKSVDLFDILNKDEGGRESVYYETFIHDNNKKIKTYHKIEIQDEKYFNESAEFVDFNTHQVT
jgi:hypothetical protein